MKKILAALALLALVFGTVTAQDGEITVKGAVKTGVRIQSGNKYAVGEDDADKAFIDAHSDDAGRVFQADVRVDYTTDNAGLSVRLRTDERSLASFNIQNMASAFGASPAGSTGGHAFGWIKLLDMIEVSGGLLNNAKWGTFTGFYLDTSLDNRNFTKIVIAPAQVEGLSLGVNLISIPMGGETEFGKAFGGSVAGIRYAVPDMFGVSASFIFDQKWALSPLSSPENDKQKAIGRPGGSESTLGLDGGNFGALFSAYYYGVENLKVDLDGRFATDSTDENSRFDIGLQANYWIMEPFYAGIRVILETEKFKVRDGKDPAYLEFRPQAGYQVTEWLEAGIQIPIGLQGTGPDGGLNDATMIIGVKPKLTFTVNENAKFVAFYELAAATPKDGDTAITNTVQLDFVWSF